MYHQDIKTGDVVCWPTNLGWMMGPWLVYASLLNQSTIALYEGAPTERGFCQFVEDAKVTMLGLVPSIVKSWRSTGAADNLDWSRLRTFSSSGEASDPGDYAWLMGLNQPKGTTKPIIEYCGGTEIGGGYIASTLLDPQRPSEFNAKVMGIDFVVLDKDNKNLCPPGEAGEVFIHPPSIGLSTRLLNADNDAVYYRDCPVIDNKPLRRHGDYMFVRPDGRFQSDGRADDTMNLGGIKVGSVEIERTVNRVDGVIETAAVGVPPTDGGPDRLVIFAVVKEESKPVRIEALKNEMQKAIKDHLSPLYRIHDVVLVDSLPRTASNKIVRRDLRARYRTTYDGAANAPQP
jgi:acetyl-CoA synthetase